MLPSKPKIFYGRDSELSDILQLFSQGTPKIAILGAGGMGKTSLARAVIHHTEITERYNQHRFFVACDAAANQVELAALIGAHVGLKPGKDLTHPVIQYFSSSSESLLILDNLETLWEPVESCGKIEEFLSLLTGVDHLALVITMRGAERPAKVAWTHPFLPLLKPLEKAAAQQTFIDIADNTHDPKEVDEVLSLTDNMPLAISLIAHLVDSEGCSHVLSRWEEEKTSLISGGYDRTSNLELSISLSLSSPRLNPHAKDLLSVLGMLPDGLSDVELVQSKLPLDNILGCKAALICTSLAYSDDQKQLKALVPIREYMQKIQPPGDHLIEPLLKHFQELLEFYMEYKGNESSSSTVVRVSSNYSNIQNVIQNGLQQGHPDLVNSIYCTCYLNNFSQQIGQGPISLIQQIQNVLPCPRNHHLETCFVVELLNSRMYSISNLYPLVSNALEHFKEFDDSDLKCDMSSATKLCGAAISLALSMGNTKWHSQGLRNLALVHTILDPYDYGYALLNVAEIDVLIGAPKNDVQSNYLYLREGNSLAANTIFKRCLKVSLEFSQIQTYCLERLGNTSYWGDLDGMSSWTAIYLVNSLQRKEKLATYKAFQFLGDVFHSQNDEHTAISLFTVALEGFTQMDVHCSRVECMLQLGDIFKGHSDLLKAVEFWEAARPMFERSSQAKQVQRIDERVANISEDLLKQRRNNLACLSELNALAGHVEELEADLSDIKDMGDVKEPGLIAA
ncbi:P-loop containing nucleoside triphosphate hydrolase protein [Mycena leptocephala]|nr:P-loop containing nucleoside triphosphate hydrolase protein [Mycena leptocephala]